MVTNVAYEMQTSKALIIEQNIRIIINTRRVMEERLADTVTNFSGAHVF